MPSFASWARIFAPTSSPRELLFATGCFGGRDVWLVFGFRGWLGCRDVGAVGYESPFRAVELLGNLGASRRPSSFFRLPFVVFPFAATVDLGVADDFESFEPGQAG